MIYFLIFTSVIIGIAGQLLMKQGVSQIGDFSEGLINFLYHAILSPWVIAGLVGYAIGTAIWLMLLSKVEVSYAYPMLSLGYIFLLIFASLFLGEHISFIRIIGVILIVIGVVLITRS